MEKCLPKYLLINICLAGILTVIGISLIWSALSSKDLPSVSTSTPPSSNQSQEATPSALIEDDRIFVTKVIDGDTIEVSDGVRVRYLGLDTPETVHPRKAVECFGKEAKAENKKLVEGKFVILEKDITDKDQYGRVLRYVFVDSPNGVLFVNDYLIRSGFAKLLTIPPDVRFADQLLEAQKQAREKRLGLWGKC